jgi:hypothetical protein
MPTELDLTTILKLDDAPFQVAENVAAPPAASTSACVPVCLKSLYRSILSKAPVREMVGVSFYRGYKTRQIFPLCCRP